MKPEEEAKELIQTLEALIDDLRTIENGKNYTREKASNELYGIRLSLGAECDYE